MVINRIKTNCMDGYNISKIGMSNSTKNFADEVESACQRSEDAIQHDLGEESGDIAVCAVLYTVSGSTYTVYKTQDFNPENPVYKIQIQDVAGNVTERMIDASKIDPKNCDTYEMDVYAVHLMETGKGSFEETVGRATMAKGGVNSSVSWDYTKKINWVEMVKDVMQSAYDYGDLKGYFEWQKFLGYMEK